MRKKANGPKRGSLGEGGGSPLGPCAKGGAHPPWPAHPPLPRDLVPHGGGEEGATPLKLYKEG